MHRKIINALIKWQENTVKMCLLLTILRLENFVESGVRDLENELFFQGHSRNNFVVIFEFERFCENLKNGSIDFFKTLNTRASRCDPF